MYVFKFKYLVFDLQLIGSVSLFGVMLIVGDLQVVGVMIYGELQDVFICGLFLFIEGSFIMIYLFIEYVIVLEGEVELIVVGGELQCFVLGDSWFVKQGIEVEWKILMLCFVKYYLVNVEIC